MRYELAAQPPAGACQFNVTVDPLTLLASAVGAPDVVAQSAASLTAISFDEALVPLAFCASTRKKYVPPGTPVVVRIGSAEPVFAFATLSSPLDDPACSTYEVGAPPTVGGVHVSTTVWPVTFAASPVGAAGGLMAVNRAKGGHSVETVAGHAAVVSTPANACPTASELVRQLHGRTTESGTWASRLSVVAAASVRADVSTTFKRFIDPPEPGLGRLRWLRIATCVGGRPASTIACLARAEKRLLALSGRAVETTILLQIS